MDLLVYGAFSVNEMFLPTNFLFKSQLDSSYSILDLTNAEISLLFCLLPSFLSAYQGTKVIIKKGTEQERAAC